MCRERSWNRGPLDRLGKETERGGEYGPTPWLTAQQRNGTRRQNYATLCVVLLRHLPAWTPATPWHGPTGRPTPSCFPYQAVKLGTFVGEVIRPERCGATWDDEPSSGQGQSLGFSHSPVIANRTSIQVWSTSSVVERAMSRDTCMVTIVLILTMAPLSLKRPVWVRIGP